MPEQSKPGWKRFWERGGLWRALLLAAVYYGVYELLSWVVELTLGDDLGEPGTPSYIFIGTALPIILASIVLVAFAASLGWLKELFARQALGGRRWMWIAIAVVLAINVSALLGIDYEKAGARGGRNVAAHRIVHRIRRGGLSPRGFVVNLMRKAGHGEIAVALASAGIFAALHFG